MSGTCFFIAPIGQAGSEVRERSNIVLDYIIKPTAELFNLKAIRADEISDPGIITNQIIKMIVEADIVIADLTGHNPNVFYELAIRHAVKKPYVQIINIGEKIPFDLTIIRTIPVDINNIKKAEIAKQEIRQAIEAALREDFVVESPLSHAIDLDALRNSDNLNQKGMADIIENIGDLKRIIYDNLVNRPDVSTSRSTKIKESDILSALHGGQDQQQILPLLRGVQYIIISALHEEYRVSVQNRTSAVSGTYSKELARELIRNHFPVITDEEFDEIFKEVSRTGRWAKVVDL